MAGATRSLSVILDEPKTAGLPRQRESNSQEASAGEIYESFLAPCRLHGAFVCVEDLWQTTEGRPNGTDRQVSSDC